MPNSQKTILLHVCYIARSLLLLKLLPIQFYQLAIARHWREYTVVAILLFKCQSSRVNAYKIVDTFYRFDTQKKSALV